MAEKITAVELYNKIKEDVTKQAISGNDLQLLVFNKERTKLIFIAGQQGGDFSRTADTIESSDKNGNKTVLRGTKSWNTTVEGQLFHGDKSQEIMEDAYENGTAVYVVQVDLNLNMVRYAGAATVTEFSQTAPQDDAAGYTANLEGKGKLHKIMQEIEFNTQVEGLA